MKVTISFKETGKLGSVNNVTHDNELPSLWDDVVIELKQYEPNRYYCFIHFHFDEEEGDDIVKTFEFEDLVQFKPVDVTIIGFNCSEAYGYNWPTTEETFAAMLAKDCELVIESNSNWLRFSLRSKLLIRHGEISETFDSERIKEIFVENI